MVASTRPRDARLLARSARCQKINDVRSHAVLRRSSHSRATRPSEGTIYPWSERFDRIFRNEEVAGSNPASSTERPVQGELASWSARQIHDPAI